MKFWTATVLAKQALDDLDQRSGVDTSNLSLLYSHSSSEQNALAHISKRFLQQSSVGFPMTDLLYIFMLHCILLREISVRERAREVEDLSPALLHTLLNDFLPAVMLAAAGSLTTLPSIVPFDIDGRVFCSLVRFLIAHHTVAIPTLIGQAAYGILAQLWSQLGLPPVNLSRLATRFPQNPLRLTSSTASPAVQNWRLLPFDNDIFNAELALVHVPVSNNDNLPNLSKLQFGGRGTLFSDTQHWHNQRAILPSYLGGSDPKPSDARARRRILRSNQRFMATMQAQAATLVGASGGALKPIIIPSVGMLKPSQKNRPPAHAIKANVC